VLQFDTGTGKLAGVFAQSDATNDLNRPEGLAFGPDGDLYITSFRADTSDTDKVEVFGGPLGTTPGAYLGKIDLAAPEALGGLRAFAQAIVFGPGGHLYVPITGGDKKVAGQIRSYDVSAGSYVVFATPAHLGQPWYPTFGKTNPATLAYGL
jgi:sugar lactone lactonase YvrE